MRQTFTFRQRSLLCPWRVYWITQAWSDGLARWVTVNKVRESGGVVKLGEQP